MRELERFVYAQHGIYETALSEITSGRKESHWMWYIFPQLRGLGRSEMACFYGIADIDEARAYLEHPILGCRLRKCCKALLSHKEKDPREIMGEIDSLKLRSSMTLFAIISRENSIFHKVICEFYDGEFDKRTIEMINNK